MVWTGLFLAILSAVYTGTILRLKIEKDFYFLTLRYVRIGPNTPVTVILDTVHPTEIF
jgi:hypothetical protein